MPGYARRACHLRLAQPVVEPSGPAPTITVTGIDRAFPALHPIPIGVSEVARMHTDPAELVTDCGRRVVAGRFRIPSTPAIERVTIRIDPDGDCCETV
jgi:hypothetical protein